MICHHLPTVTIIKALLIIFLLDAHSVASCWVFCFPSSSPQSFPKRQLEFFLKTHTPLPRILYGVSSQSQVCSVTPGVPITASLISPPNTLNSAPNTGLSYCLKHSVHTHTSEYWYLVFLPGLLFCMFEWVTPTLHLRMYFKILFVRSCPWPLISKILSPPHL